MREEGVRMIGTIDVSFELGRDNFLMWVTRLGRDVIKHHVNLALEAEVSTRRLIDSPSLLDFGLLFLESFLLVLLMANSKLLLNLTGIGSGVVAHPGVTH